MGKIISRFEKKGFKLIGLKLFECLKELVEVCGVCHCIYFIQMYHLHIMVMILLWKICFDSHR